jgi:hypothetical protein
MRLRLARVNDLIVVEGKYHNKCLNAFILPKHVASMHEESTGFLFQQSTDEVGVQIDIRH